MTTQYAKRHYETFADLLLEANRRVRDFEYEANAGRVPEHFAAGYELAVGQLTQEICDLFARDNSRFDVARFKDAARVRG